MKTKRDAFNAHHARYEAWFSHPKAAYHSELLAVRASLRSQGLGVQIRVGNGGFTVVLATQRQ